MPSVTPPREFNALQGIVGGKTIGLSPDEGGNSFSTFDANTATTLPGRFSDAEPNTIADAATLAHHAAEPLANSPNRSRADWFLAVVEGMEQQRDLLLSRFRQETGYIAARAEGELRRAIHQLELFAQLTLDDEWRDPKVDPANPDRKPFPRPQLRREMMPIGPVAVFGACNFPLAISVVGNDTVAAIAVGCPVIVKSHPAHAGTCQLLGEIASQAVQQVGLPQGTFSLLHGQQPQTSIALVQQPAIAAVGFTGSPQGGIAIAKALLQRPRPIPLYAELGSTNPVFLLQDRMQESHREIADGFFNSLTFGNGQMCTKPGVLIAVRGAATDRFLNHLQDRMVSHSALPLVSESVAEGFDRGVQRLEETSTMRRLPVGDTSGLGPWHRHPRLFVADYRSDQDLAWLHQETFGPVSVVLLCDQEEQMLEIASAFQGSLTATLHSANCPSELSQQETLAGRLLQRIRRFAGRVIWNGWPTGMEIGPATMHGGPYPASIDGRSTSVGFDSVLRFIRPVCLQNGI